MLSHDQLIFAMKQLYPALVHGHDFWVAHPVAVGSVEQTGEAEIVVWPEAIPPPSRAALQAAFEQQAADFYAPRVRAERNVRLQASDWTQMLDIPEAMRQAWAHYRQALRDLPQQSGFPQRIDWPELPNT